MTKGWGKSVARMPGSFAFVKLGFVLIFRRFLTLKYMQTKHIFAVGSLFALASGAVGGALGSWAVLSYEMKYAVPAPQVAVSSGSSYEDVWASAAPAVVSIVARKSADQLAPQSLFFAPAPLPDENGLVTVSSGTGFLISADGMMVSNRHVVGDEQAEYSAILSDGTELPVQVLGRDPLNDIALLKIEGKDLPHLEFADSDQVQVGEAVLAIGNALGEYSNTSTAGIISAKGRQLSASGPGFGSEALVDLLQTDAAINPGNSGGPLLDLQGKVLGMNTAVDTSAAGIGFAIPANEISAVVQSYKETGRIVRPFLGVRYVMVNPGIQARLGLDKAYGALIFGDENGSTSAIIKGSSADKAGLKAQDVVLSVDGKNIEDGFTLSAALVSRQVGETLHLEVWREGKILNIDLVLEERQPEA